MKQEATYGKQNQSFSNRQLRHILEAVPANVFFKDTAGRYQIVSSLCNVIHAGGDGSVLGKTVLEVQKDPALGRKFYDEDMEIIRTGQSLSYLQEVFLDGAAHYYEISKTPAYDDDGSILGITGIIQDMTDNIRMRQKLQEYNETDPLTGAYNRTYYRRLTSGEIPLHYPVSVIMADCNELKGINDTFGHSCGDDLLVSTVDNIRHHLNERGRIIRLGGDEFLILISDCGEDECRRQIRQFKESEAAVFVFDRPLSTAYGYAVMHSREMSLEDAVNLADRRMYEAKFKARTITG